MLANSMRCLNLAVALAAAVLFTLPVQAELGPLSPMTRYVSFVTRPAGQSHADFMAALTAQAMKAKMLSRPLGGLIVSEVLAPANARLAQPDIDAIVELWNADEADHAALLSSADGKKWAAGMDALYARNTTCVTKERVYIAPRRGDTVKGIGLLMRKAGMTKPDFLDHWINIHGAMATKVPGLSGFVISEVQKIENPKGEILMPEIDGIGELWWESPPGAAPGASVPSDYANAWYRDGKQFVNHSTSLVLNAKGKVIIPVSQ